MKRSLTMRRVVPALLALAGMLLLAGCPNKGQGGSGGSGQRASAEQRAAGGGGGAQFTQFREDHRYTFQLSQMARKIERLEKDGLAPLTGAQAKAILAVLTPLRSKDKLTQDEAKDAIKGLKQALSEKQLTEMGKMQTPQRRTGGQRPANGERSAGDRPRFDPEQMKDFNPFNPPQGAPVGGGNQNWDDFFAMLDKKAK